MCLKNSIGLSSKSAYNGCSDLTRQPAKKGRVCTPHLVYIPVLFAVSRCCPLHFLYGSAGGVLFHLLDAVLHLLLGGEHLAGADHLPVARLEVEEVLAVGRGLALVAARLLGVLLHGLYAVHAARLGAIAFAGQDVVAVVGLQAEAVFSAGIFIDFEFSHGCLG